MIYANIHHENERNKKFFEKKMSIKKNKKPKQRSTMRKLNDIYRHLSGKQIIVTSAEENHIEDRYFEKFIINEWLNAFFAFFSMLSSVAYYEFSIDTLSSESSSESYHYYLNYLYTCSFFSLCLWVNIILETVTLLEYEKEMKIYADHHTIFTTKYYKLLLVKLIIFFIHPNILTEGYYYNSYVEQASITIERKVNYIFCIIILFRCYFLFTFLVYISSYMHPESNRICKKYFFEADVEYSIKCLVHNHPIAFYPISMLIFLFSFAFSVRVFENGVGNYNFSIMWNSLYFILVTMTTVGYGDIVATTNEGRTIAMISCIFGIFLISMMIISVNRLLTMTTTEMNALVILERVYSNKELEESAKKVILQLQKIRKSNTSLKDTIKYEKIHFRKLKAALKSFNELHQNSKCFGDSTFNTIYNSISVVTHDQDEFENKDLVFSDDLKKLRDDLQEVYDLMMFDKVDENSENLITLNK